MDECILWDKSLTKDGYGIKWDKHNKIMRLAHRVIYEQERGLLLPGFEIDHICKNKPCVNVNHLRPITPFENKSLADKPGKRITHCPKNHPYSGENLYITPKGKRVCRECNRESVRAQRRKKKLNPHIPTVNTTMPSKG